MSDQQTWDFNQMELATYEEARAIRNFLNFYNTGGGILPGDDESAAPANPNFPWLPTLTSPVGIYEPSWVGGPGGFPRPNATGGKRFLHFRFKNGGEGMNVGLVIDRFKRYPTAPIYVINSLNQEAATLPGAH